MKHHPIDSNYIDKHVVENRVGDKSYFPHEGQLADILKALTIEFRGGIPDRISRVDRRGLDFDKMQLHLAAVMFCNYINAKRADKIVLHPLVNADRVAKIAIAQEITERTENGNLHWFKFYAGQDFFTELHLNGRTLVFASHALDRFSERVPNHLGTDVTALFGAVFACPAIVMQCNSGPAFVYNYRNSIIAFPFIEFGNEYLLLTCLSVDQINRLNPLTPTEGYAPRYDPIAGQPGKRNWDVSRWTEDMMYLWQTKSPPQPPLLPLAAKEAWPDMGHRIKGKMEKRGMGPNSIFAFYDDIPGPATIRWRDGLGKHDGENL